MTVARRLHTATLLGNGKVLIAGGENWPPGNNTLLSADLYDPSVGTFSATGAMTAARSWHTATLLENGEVLITGGFPGLASAELYNPWAGTFTATGNMNVARRWQTATLLGNGKVLIEGGDSGDGSYTLASAELYE
jgi:hypothetical protein